ncbi:tyrosine-type recombinase/integrase [bacterium]|nr:tyrosine-type recombinase/integrase [bacterium]MBP9811263.1 tyrosine-type recombinase/integrase [bacterium]
MKKSQSSFSGKLQFHPAGPPVKQKNLARRSREFLTADEVKLLIATAKAQGRYGIRDSLLILMTYRHALRVGEVVDLKWDQVDMDNAKLYVNRLKNGDSSVHYLEGDELRALRKLKRDSTTSAFVFCSERKGPLTTSSVHKLVARTGKLAGMEFPIHPHMLRHAKGYQLASKGVDTRAIQAYFGHKNIQHTVVYTKLDPSRFKGFGKDL